MTALSRHRPGGAPPLPVRPPPQPGIPRLAAANAGFLRQGMELVARLSDAQYRERPPLDSPLSTAPALFARGAVGAHFRHVLDHYASFFDGLAGGLVDYDRRERERALELERALCQERLAACVERLGRLGPRERDLPLETALGVSGPGPEAAARGRSSVERELQFLASHTVHHYAIIAVISRLHGVEPGDEFGVAPSTLDYERGAARCAP